MNLFEQKPSLHFNTDEPNLKNQLKLIPTNILKSQNDITYFNFDADNSNLILTCAPIESNNITFNTWI